MPHYDSSHHVLINQRDPSHLDKADQLLSLNNGQPVLEIGCGKGHPPQFVSVFENVE